MVVEKLAIENIWIIDSLSGICIFDWYSQQRDKRIDEQLVSGLLLAFKNFSSEAGLVDISAIEGIDKKLAYQADERFIIAGICHSRDYEKLIDDTLLDLLTKFRKKYSDLIEDGMTTDVSPFRTFDEDIINRLEGTTASRNAITLTVGVIISLFVSFAVFGGYFFLVPLLQNALGFDTGNLLGLTIVIFCMILSGFFGGLIAGDRRLGMIAGGIAVLPIVVLLFSFFRQDWSSGSYYSIIVFTMMYLLLFGAMAILGGLLGGYLKESKYFLPAVDSEEIENLDVE